MPTKVLMVCLGNICRSPLAEGILSAKVDPELVVVDSAGTAGYHIGEKPDPRSIAVAKNHGIDISRQRCRKFTAQDFLDFDHIYAMDSSNYQNIIALADTSEKTEKVKLLLMEIEGGPSEVPDPYYGGEQGFEHVFAMINTACEIIARQFSKDLNNG